MEKKSCSRGQVHETSKDNKQNSFLPSIQPGVLLLADKDNSLPCEPNPIGVSTENIFRFRVKRVKRSSCCNVLKRAPRYRDLAEIYNHS